MSTLPRARSRRIKWLLAATLLACAALILARLGRTALWDDEANTALTAKSLLRNGDITPVVDDHNFFASDSGFEIRDLKIRYVPPLPAALTAVSFALTGEVSALSARLPFALFGLGGIALILWWTYGSDASELFCGLMAAAVVGNVSLLLFSRQCRYYAPAFFFTVAIARCYLGWNGRRRTLALMAALSALLCASNYLLYAAVSVCLIFDYVVWQRSQRPLTPREWALLLAPQVMVGAAILYVWNPWAVSGAPPHNTLWLRLILFGREWRDANRCEFLSAGVMIFGAVLAIRRRDRWLARGFMALVSYFGFLAAISPERIPADSVDSANRYLVPCIPLCLFLASRTICVGTNGRAWLAWLCASIAFGTNFLNGGALLWKGAPHPGDPLAGRPEAGRNLHSALALFVGELARPLVNPYNAIADWINDQLPPGTTVVVRPRWMTAPLMFHAPKAIYGWQLDPPPRGQFSHLPRILFEGLVPPDVLIVAHPSDLVRVTQLLRYAASLGIRYDCVATFDLYYDANVERPELHSHAFAPVTQFDRRTEGIYIFERRRAGPLSEGRSNTAPRAAATGR